MINWDVNPHLARSWRWRRGTWTPGSRAPRRRRRSPRRGPGGWLSPPHCARPAACCGAACCAGSASLCDTAAPAPRRTWPRWRGKWRRNTPPRPRRRRCRSSASSCGRRQERVNGLDICFVAVLISRVLVFVEHFFYVVSKNSQAIRSAVRKLPIGDETIVIFVHSDHDDDYNHRDAPAGKREPQHVVRYVVVEDLDEGQVHVDRLQSHPGEGNQQEVVKEPGGGDAEAQGVWVERQPSVNQEDEVQQQQRQTQLDQDFGWNVLTQLPAGIKWGRWFEICICHKYLHLLCGILNVVHSFTLNHEWVFKKIVQLEGNRFCEATVTLIFDL